MRWLADAGFALLDLEEVGPIAPAEPEPGEVAYRRWLATIPTRVGLAAIRLPDPGAT